MQRCVAPRRSALSLSLLPASSELYPRTIMYICSQRISMVVRGPNKSTSLPRYGVSACSVQWRAAPPRGQFVFSTSAIRCDPHQWWETALTSALLQAAKRASRRRRGQSRWQCCQPGAPSFSCPVSLAVLSARCTLIFLGSCCIEPENRLFACLFVCLFVCLLVTSGKQMDLFFWFVMPPHS